MKKTKKKRKKLGPFIFILTSKNGEKYFRVLLKDTLLFGANNIEKGKKIRGKHLHFYLDNLYEVKLFLDGKWPVIVVKKTRKSIRSRRRRGGD